MNIINSIVIITIITITISVIINIITTMERGLSTRKGDELSKRTVTGTEQDDGAQDDAHTSERTDDGSGTRRVPIEVGKQRGKQRNRNKANKEVEWSEVRRDRGMTHNSTKKIGRRMN